MQTVCRREEIKFLYSINLRWKLQLYFASVNIELQTAPKDDVNNTLYWSGGPRKTIFFLENLLEQ